MNQGLFHESVPLDVRKGFIKFLLKEGMYEIYFSSINLKNVVKLHGLRADFLITALMTHLYTNHEIVEKYKNKIDFLKLDEKWTAEYLFTFEKIANVTYDPDKRELVFHYLDDREKRVSNTSRLSLQNFFNV